MQSQIVLSKSLNSIVFEGRNKAYGAFYLRNEYEKHILKSFAFVLLFIFLVSTFSVFNPFKKEKILAPQSQPIVQVTKVLFEQKLEFEKPKPPLPQHSQPQALGTVLPTRITDQPIVEPILQTPTLPSTVGNPLGTATATTSITTIPSGIISNNTTESHKVFTEFGVEKMAEYPGGEEAMQEYLGKHIHFTNFAKDNLIEGKVVINFIIDENGKIVDCKVLRSLGFGLDEIALDAIMKMPNWKPAEQSNRKVPVSFTMPIQFSLSY
jgi:protein TonB